MTRSRKFTASHPSWSIFTALLQLRAVRVYSSRADTEAWTRAFFPISLCTAISVLVVARMRKTKLSMFKIYMSFVKDYYTRIYCMRLWTFYEVAEARDTNNDGFVYREARLESSRFATHMRFSFCVTYSECMV